jgi:Stress responsive A/B Barrel Domain
VIAHVVLFEPRHDLPQATREAFAASLERALTSIPQVRRARVGKRQNQSRLYDQLNVRDFPYIAIIEFETAADLRIYLDHPAHEELGRLFYETSQNALVYDFALHEGQETARVFRDC